MGYFTSWILRLLHYMFVFWFTVQSVCIGAFIGYVIKCEEKWFEEKKEKEKALT